MKVKFSLLLIVIISLCCTKRPAIKYSYKVEDFREQGISDFQTIQAALDSVPEGATIVFSSKIYELDHTPIVNKSIHFIGNSTIIKRADQNYFSLKENATNLSTYLILNTTENISIPDRIILVLGNDGKSASALLREVVKISGDTIFLNHPVGNTVDGRANYPSGTSLIKNVNFFWLFSYVKYPDASCSFDGITFDGNRDNNNVSNYWAVNAACVFLTRGLTTYTHCSFINSSNESIVGHNASIDSCIFENLNGSAFHTSADRELNPENTIHSNVTNSCFENTNQVPTSVTGHSEGCITHSNSGGYYTATGNTFINVGEDVIGDLYPSVSPQDWGTSNILFTGNIINSKGTRIAPGALLIPGILKNVRIEKNTIINMKSANWATVFSYWPDIVIKQNTGE